MESVKFTTTRRGMRVSVVSAQGVTSLRLASVATARELSRTVIPDLGSTGAVIAEAMSLIERVDVTTWVPKEWTRPAHLTGLIVVSFGLGIDSMGVLVGLYERGIRPDEIVFADTGSEKRETYAYLAFVRAWLAAVGFPPLTVLVTRTRKGLLYSLEQHAYRTHRLAAFAYGGASCSLKFKGQKIDAHVAKLPAVVASIKRGEPIIRIVGYDNSKADLKRAAKGSKAKAYLLSPQASRDLAAITGRSEESEKERKSLAGRIARARKDAAENSWWYALQEWLWQRADCVAAIERNGLPPPPKSACYFCPANHPHELVELLLTNPEQAYRIVVMEALAMPSHKKDVGLWRSEIKGSRKGKGGTRVLNGATAHPLYMSVYLLDWIPSGRAFDRWMPELNRKGTAAETAAMEHVGALYNGGKLRVIASTTPDPAAMVALREKAQAAAALLAARCEDAGLLVDGRPVRHTDSVATKARVAIAAWSEVLRMHPSGVMDGVSAVRGEPEDDADAEVADAGDGFCPTPDDDDDDPTENGPDYGGGTPVVIPMCERSA